MGGKGRGDESATGRTGDMPEPRDLVIVSNFPRPFRVHIDTRVAREIDNLSVHLFYFRSGSDYLSTVQVPEELNAVVLAGQNEKRTTRWWGRPFQDWRKAGPIMRHLEDHNVCGVIFEGYASILILRLLRHCRRLGVPTFIRADSNISNDKPATALHAWLKRRLLGWVVRNTSGFMPMGSRGQEYFVKYGARPDQCFWVPSIPDYDLFANVPKEEIEKARQEFGLSRDRRYLVYSGRFIPVKRLDQLLEAFERIADDRQDWDLLMVGAGPLEEELKRSIPDRLNDRVKWLGFCPWEQLRAIYHAADVLALSSTSEAWGLVILEASAAGMVVVASDIVAAADELIEDGVNGRRFRAGDVDDLTGALHDVTDPEGYRRLHAAVGPSLEDWKKRADPVDGVRRALQWLEGPA